jgi:hypothetical protein
MVRRFQQLRHRGRDRASVQSSALTRLKGNCRIEAVPGLLDLMERAVNRLGALAAATLAKRPELDYARRDAAS